MRKRLTGLAKIFVVALTASMMALPAQALITNADIVKNAGISYSKLKLKGKIDSDDIKDRSIKGKDIKKGTISEDELDDDSVGSDEIKGDAVGTSEIDDGSITAADLAAGTLTAATLADGSVATAEILDGTILVGDLADGAVTSAKILNETIVSADIFDGTITAADLGADSVAASELADSSVGTGEITDLTIINADVNAAAAIAGTKISPDFGAQAITTSGAISTTGSGTITAGGRIYTDAGFDAVTGGAVLHIGELNATQIALDSSIVALGNEGTDSVRSKGDFSVRNNANDADTFTIDNNTGDTVVGGDLTVTGGEVYATPIADSASTTEGTIYYDSTDDNLYVYANGGFVDLTAGASGAPTLDDAYNAGSGTETEIHVDNGNLTLSSEDTTAGGGDIMVDLTNEGDFLVQNAGVTYATFDDSGNVAFTGTLGVTGATTQTGLLTANGGITADGGVFSVADTTGNTTIQGTLTTGNIIAYGAGADQAITLDAKGAAGITLGSADVTALTVTTDGTGTAEVALPAGSIDSTEILNATIAGEDLAADIAVTTTGTTALNGNTTLGNNTDDTLTINATIQDSTAFVFEGLTANDFETSLAISDPSADAIVTLPNTTGTLITTGDTGTVTSAMITNATIVGGDLAADIAVTTSGLTTLNGGITADGGVFSVADTTGNTTIQGTLTTGNIIAYGAGADQAITLDAKGAAGITLGSADVTALTVTTDGTGTAEVALPAGSIDSTEILDDTVASADIAANTIVAGDIAADAIDGASLADTITLDAAFAMNAFDVTIGEDLNVNGDEIDADGTLDITGATGVGLNTPAGDIAITAADSGAGDGDITLNADSGAGNVTVTGDFEVAADSTYNIGADATRWATIFADTLNYSAALTDDNSGNTTVTMGGDVALDTVNIDANTDIADGQWTITNLGVATFASVDGPVGSVTPAAGTFTTLIGDTVQADTTVSFSTNGDSVNNTADDTFDFTREDAGTVTITASDDDATAALAILPGGAAALTLGGASTTAITLTTDGTGNGELSLPADSIGDADIDWGTGAGQVSGADITFAEGDMTDSTIVSADIKDATIAGGDLAADIAITTSGTTTSTGAVNFSGATSLRVPAIAEALVDGADAGTSCAAGNLGDVRIDTNNVFFGCDGTNWQQLSN